MLGNTAVKDLARLLRSIARIRIPTSENERFQPKVTLDAVRIAIRTVADILNPPRDIQPGVGADTLAEHETGPENSREEVVGTSTRGKSSNLSNSGYGGGRPQLGATICALKKVMVDHQIIVA